MSQVNEWFTVLLGKSRWAGIEALFSIHTFNTAVTARLQHKSPSKSIRHNEVKPTLTGVINTTLTTPLQHPKLFERITEVDEEIQELLSLLSPRLKVKTYKSGSIGAGQYGVVITTVCDIPARTWTQSGERQSDRVGEPFCDNSCSTLRGHIAA